MLTAYLDESGIHEGDHLCVVAGFVGNNAQWEAFIADWIPAIRPRANLHMKDLRWNKHPKQIASLLAKLGPIPHKYNLIPVGVSLHWKDYYSVDVENTGNKFVNPYVLCAVSCISAVLEEVVGKDDVYFVFDRQERLRKEAIQVIRDFSFDVCGIDSRFTGSDFINRSTTVCLDPADYLAYLVRERGIDAESFKSKACASIMGTRGCYGGRIELDQLTSMVDWWKEDHSPSEIITDLAKRRFFRGPR